MTTQLRNIYSVIMLLCIFVMGLLVGTMLIPAATITTSAMTTGVVTPLPLPPILSNEDPNKIIADATKDVTWEATCNGYISRRITHFTRPTVREPYWTFRGMDGTLMYGSACFIERS